MSELPIPPQRRGVADDLGLFGPESVTWQVHGNPILFLAGLRALFLQALHPRAIAGVVQNSGYQADPWGRLAHTVNFVATTIYGTTAEAEAAGRRVRAVHARLSATDPATGERFRVDEPELLRWVHVSEIESYADTARRAGVRLPAALSGAGASGGAAAEAPDLAAAGWDAYHDEQRRRAALVGLDPATVPGSTAEVAAYYREIRPRLRMTRDAADTLVFLTTLPPPWRDTWLTRLGRPPFRVAGLGVAAAALALLPPWARRMYGGLGLPTTDLLAGASAWALQRTLAALPHHLYEGPMYRAAMARAREAREAVAPG